MLQLRISCIITNNKTKNSIMSMKNDNINIYFITETHFSNRLIAVCLCTLKYRACCFPKSARYTDQSQLVNKSNNYQQRDIVYNWQYLTVYLITNKDMTNVNTHCSPILWSSSPKVLKGMVHNAKTCLYLFRYRECIMFWSFNTLTHQEHMTHSKQWHLAPLETQMLNSLVSKEVDKFSKART